MKKIVPNAIGLLFIALSFYISIYFEDVTKNLVSRSGLGWVISTIILRVMVCLAFARGIQLIIKTFIPRLKSIFVFIPGLLVGFAISFISPIYESDYGNFSTQDMAVEHKPLTELTNGQYTIKNAPYIVAFFTTDCPHCKAASKLLAFAKSIGNTPDIVAIFPGEEEDSKRFIAENNASHFEHYTVNNDTFFLKNSGGVFPSIFLLDQSGKTIAHWFGDGFNYTALDYIEAFSK